MINTADKKQQLAGRYVRQSCGRQIVTLNPMASKKRIAPRRLLQQAILSEAEGTLVDSVFGHEARDAIPFFGIGSAYGSLQHLTINIYAANF